MKRILWNIFKDPQWANLSQREIAAHTGIGKTKVYENLKSYREKTGEDGPRKGPEPSNKGTTSAAAAATAPSVPRPGRTERRTDEGTTEAPDEVEASQPETPAEPWAEFEALIRDVQSDLRAVYKKLALATQYDTNAKRMNNPWARSYSPGGTLGTLSSLAKTLEDGLPVELSDQPPGFITSLRAKMRSGVAKKVG